MGAGAGGSRVHTKHIADKKDTGSASTARLQAEHTHKSAVSVGIWIGGSARRPFAQVIPDTNSARPFVGYPWPRRIRLTRDSVDTGGGQSARRPAARP